MSGRREGRRVILREAAEDLGISGEAVRKRTLRGTLRSDNGEDVRVYANLDAVQDLRETPESDALISSKDETIAVLREPLEAEREANRESRRIIAALTSRIPELEAPASPERRGRGM